MDITVLLKQMAELFLMIFLGCLLFKTGIMNVEFNKRLTKLVLNVTMPAMILASVFKQVASGQGGRDSGVFFILFFSLALYIILPAAAFILVKIMRIPKQKQGLYMFMTTFSNIGFMGFPVVEALYGDKAVFYTALVNIIFTIAAFTLGLVLIHYGVEGSAAFSPKTLLTPGISLSILAVIIYFLNIPFPSIIVETVNSVGSLTSPLAMMLIGSTLATMKIGEVFSDVLIYPYTLFKQILLPLLLFPAFSFFIRDTYLRNTMFVLLLMPVANNSILFSTEYGNDEKLAARTVFITTVFSLISIPLISYFTTI